MAEPGDRYDRFVVEAKLGQGGMATVYRVRHQVLGSFHALKVLDLPLPGIRARLVQEGRLQSRLGHPNIVAVTDLIDVDGAPGLVMEYVPGASLDLWLQAHRTDEATAWALTRGVLDAVAFAHRQGLVHRDLKPGNVLVHEVDGRVVPKVTDFGLAKLLSGDPSESHTRTGLAMGTPGYMAPEQVRNAKDVDARADIFALGCVFYEIWCGIPAFPGRDVFAALETMERRGYVDPRAQRPDLPDAVHHAIVAALEPDRDRRAASCEALRALLDSPRAAPRASAWSDPGEIALDAGGAAVAAPPRPAAWPPADPPPLPAGTFDPHLSPPSLVGPSRATVSRSTTVGAAAGLGAVVGVAVAALLACAGGLGWYLTLPDGPPTDPVVPAPSPPASEVATPPPPASTGPADAAPSTPTAPATDHAPDALRRGEPPLTLPRPASAGFPSPAAALPSPVAPIEPAPVEPAPIAPVAAAPSVPRPAAPAGDTPARFSVTGDVDAAWLDARGRRIAPGPVEAGSYTLHARWGTVEVERKVVLTPGAAVVATCDRTFFDCVVR